MAPLASGASVWALFFVADSCEELRVFWQKGLRSRALWFLVASLFLPSAPTLFAPLFLFWFCRNILYTAVLSAPALLRRATVGMSRVGSEGHVFSQCLLPPPFWLLSASRCYIAPAFPLRRRRCVPSCCDVYGVVVGLTHPQRMHRWNRPPQLTRSSATCRRLSRDRSLVSL